MSILSIIFTHRLTAQTAHLTARTARLTAQTARLTARTARLTARTARTARLPNQGGIMSHHTIQFTRESHALVDTQFVDIC